MTTALNIIERALLDIEVLGEGDSPTARQGSDGLLYLNDLIQSWSIEGLLVNSLTTDTLTLTGATSYTFGTGGTFNAARPVRIANVYYTLNGFDYPIYVINNDQYVSISDKDATGQPYQVYINYTYPLATIYPYPVTSSGTLNVVSEKPLTEPATQATVLSLPPGYERALRLSLGVEMMPQYGVQNQLIMQMADKAKKDLLRINSANSPALACLDLPNMSSRRGGNILTGY